MKKIEAVLLESKVEPILQRLRRLEVTQLITEAVTVFDEHAGPTMTYRGCRYTKHRLPRTRVNFVVSDQDAPLAEQLLES